MSVSHVMSPRLSMANTNASVLRGCSGRLTTTQRHSTPTRAGKRSFTSSTHTRLSKRPTLDSMSTSVLRTRSLFLAPASLAANSKHITRFASQSSNMASNFLSAVQNRRTRYALNDKSTISDDRIEEILKTTVQMVPSSFNVQSTRYVVLLKDQHKKYWDIVKEVLEPHIKEATREATEQKVAGFRKAYGTILFYEDPDPIDDLKRKVPQYADHFGQWSEHSNAMNQYAVWTAFDAEGLGANLQHYNPLVDQRIAAEWNVPLTWKLMAQLVFGGCEEGELEPKPKEPVEKKLFIHGK